MRKCLILGRDKAAIEKIIPEVDNSSTTLFAGTSLQDLINVFDLHKIDIVIIGAGLDIMIRTEIIKYIYAKSKTTSVHMKDWESGARGMLPFINGVLGGIKHTV